MGLCRGHVGHVWLVWLLGYGGVNPGVNRYVRSVLGVNIIVHTHGVGPEL